MLFQIFFCGFDRRFRNDGTSLGFFFFRLLGDHHSTDQIHISNFPVPQLFSIHKYRKTHMHSTPASTFHSFKICLLFFHKILRLNFVSLLLPMRCMVMGYTLLTKRDRDVTANSRLRTSGSTRRQKLLTRHR
jgi:hypothetical protein